MKLAIVVLLVCVGFSQAFDAWGLFDFNHWKGEVQEALDSSDKEEHAERFLKEVHDKGLELSEDEHHDLRNKVQKVWKKVQKVISEEPELPTTEPFEPEIKPNEPKHEPNTNLTEDSLELGGSYEEVHEGYVELVPIKHSEESIEGYEKPNTESWEEPTENYEPTEDYEESSENKGDKEPTEGYVEPTEDYVEPTEDYVESTQGSEEESTKEPAIEPTEIVPEVKPEEPTEQLIVEPIDESIDNGNDDDYDDYDDEDDNDHHDDNDSRKEEIVSVELKPNKEKVISVDQLDVAPKESWEGYLEPAEIKWLNKRKHKLRKLWKKFTAKGHSEKVLNKIRKLEEKMAMRREE